MARLSNPFAFAPIPVTIFTVAIYAAILTSLIITHTVVPPAPSHPPKGVNLTEAWSDLQFITSGFHHFNSRFNDRVRDYLLERIDYILHSNGQEYALERDTPTKREVSRIADLPAVTVIDDQASEVTFAGDSGYLSVYFEGNNIIVAIRGTEYGDECYQPSEERFKGSHDTKKGAVLVNAHFDSVSTGYGATDDGVGVVTVLQLIRYFTTPGNEPKRCLVLLLNNGEEDYLNGAKAFMKHPISKYAHTFLNLEGAGAGGRAALFRSTDTEVTKFYKKAKYPFGTVITADGFQLGLVRSQTDYIVFNGELGLRGLDVAFTEPRAKYHTSQDSARETSVRSLWHMLSGAIATVQGLASDTSTEFDGKADSEGRVKVEKGSESIWFDLFGRAFAIIQLHTLFAFSVTLLVFTPLLFIALTVILVRTDKWYLFARKAYVHSPDDDEAIPLHGWRGFFRFPIVSIVSSGIVIALAFLYAKVNPLIVYSSDWAVWSSMLAAWFSVSWFLLRGADATRPSALHRMYALIWMYVGGFILLVGFTIAENNYHIAGGYFLVIYFAAVSAALLLSYLELFALPTKTSYVELLNSGDPQSPTRPLLDESGNDTGDNANETTSLLRGDRQSFARYGSRRQSVDNTEYSGETALAQHLGTPYQKEQPWSGTLPSSIWLLQFLLIGPIVILVVGEIGLTIVAALRQTPADGSDALTVYLLMAALSIFLVGPVGPFMHRFSYHIPTFFLFILIGTLIYNLVAFPFSANNRLKVFFFQQVDCETGANNVSLTGLDAYVHDIIAAIPSAAGRNVTCTAPDLSARRGLTKCIWEGLPPKPVPAPLSNSTTPFGRMNKKKIYEQTWLEYNVTRTGPKTASFWIRGENTRACRLFFNQRISDFHIEGASHDTRFQTVPPKGATEVRLWHREWNQAWNVNVTWKEEAKGEARIKSDELSGRVACLWSDQNDNGVIPALEEVRRFMPTWSIVTKLQDGLVEGSKRFEI